MLAFSYLDPMESSSIPQRQLNGGLYTGTPFQLDAPWGNVPVIPEADGYVTQNLKRTDIPLAPMSYAMIPGESRPGNNTQTLPPYQSYNLHQYKNLQCVFP
jgi:hypothetical protein